MLCAPGQKSRKQLAQDFEAEQTARQTCEEELTSVKKKLSEVETKLSENEKTLEKKVNELTNLSSINDLLAKQIEDTKEVAWKSFKERNQFEEEVQRVRGDNVLLQMEINETKETVFNSFKQKINNAEEELEDIYIVQEKYKRDLAETQSRLEEVTKEKETLENLYNETENRLQKFTEDYDTCAIESRDHKTQLDSTRSEMQKMRCENELLLVQLNKARVRIDRMSGEQDILKEKFQTFKQSFEKVLHEKKVLTNEHHLTKRELESVVGEKQLLEDKLLETKGELRKVMRQTETFLNELNAYRNASADQASSEAHEYKAHLQTTKAELQRLSNYINQSKSYVFETRRYFEAHMKDTMVKVAQYLAADKNNTGTNTEVDEPPAIETISLPFEAIEEQLKNAINDLGNPFVEQKLLLDNIRNSSIEGQQVNGHTADTDNPDADPDRTTVSDETRSEQNDDTEDLKTSLESMETVVFNGHKPKTITPDHLDESESRRGSQTAEGLRHISHIIEKRKFEDLKDAIIAKNRYVNTIIQQMIEDVNLLTEKLPKPTLFGRKKANARKEIINRLHTHLNAAVKGQVEV